MRKFKILISSLVLLTTLVLLSACITNSGQLSVTCADTSITVGESIRLEASVDGERIEGAKWVLLGDAATISEDGTLTAYKTGRVTVIARYADKSDSIEIIILARDCAVLGHKTGILLHDGEYHWRVCSFCNETVEMARHSFDAGVCLICGEREGVEDLTSDPYVGVSKAEFYANYTPATSYMDAYYRTQHGFLSGRLEIPSAAPVVDKNQPRCDGLLLRNTDMHYLDGGNTYVVYDKDGVEAFRVYRGGAYITLEEVAAYMFAFGGEDNSFPPNYTSKKKPNPQTSIWGEYLRGNHSYFSGDTEKYPREPKLPNITGCGGDLQYWEMDIGTHGYNNGSKITRGACRIVYGRDDLDRDGVYEDGELHLFYTYNHYDDFQEYLNYEGGWGDIFGYNQRPLGSSKPTAYIKVAYGSFTTEGASILAVCLPPYFIEKQRAA
ncbi:MAG: hypothetical protein J6Q85_03425 [Clostridia bacterium]|nr:hypothetical protein [Clostridia bacterium]